MAIIMAPKKSKKGENGKNKRLDGPVKKMKKHSKRKAPSRDNKRHISHNKRPKFTLKLPSSNAVMEYNQVPWWSNNNNITASNNTSSCSSISVLRHISNENLKRLDQELMAFSHYVRLTPQEHQARDRVIQHVKDICVNLFGNDKTTKRQDNHNNNEISIQAFGSFATPQVCTFQSDVDVIVWGVVPVAHARTGTIALDQEDSSTRTACQKRSDVGAELDTAAASGNNETVVQEEMAYGDPLFVIDRVGDPVVKEEKKETNDAKMPAVLPETTTRQESQVYGSISSRTRARTAQSSSVSREQEEAEVDAIGQVFADTNGSNDSTASVAGPTEETKKSVVKALNSLGRAFRKSSVIRTVEVRRHAKIPIIAMRTNLGFEFDVGVGGHNGTDTSQYAATQVQRFASFAPVVMFLKVLLGQQALDKPFTGGFGSYKLYVLVAYHLEQHLAMGGADRPSEVLATFLFRFRKFCDTQSSQRQPDTPLETVLSLDRNVECDGGSADLQAAFKLEHCSNLFQQCYSRLIEELESPNYSTDSFLATIVHPGPLQRERDWNLAKASQAGRRFQVKRSPVAAPKQAKKQPADAAHKQVEPQQQPQEQQYQFNSTAPLGLQQKWHERWRSQAKQVRNDQAQTQKDPPRPAAGQKRTRPDVKVQRQSMTHEAVDRLTQQHKKQKRDEGLKEFIALAEPAKGGAARSGSGRRSSRSRGRRSKENLRKNVVLPEATATDSGRRRLSRRERQKMRREELRALAGAGVARPIRRSKRLNPCVDS